MEKINNSIDSLESNFKNKVIDFLREVRIKYPNVEIFEWIRSNDRQKELYSIGRRWIPWEKPVTWTIQSNHFLGKAVDLVFRVNWVQKWEWDYQYLIEVAKKYWINNLAPKELCHFECDWTIYNPMQWYEWQYKNKYWDNWTIFKDLSAIDKLIEEWNIKELAYFILIWLERIKK